MSGDQFMLLVGISTQGWNFYYLDGLGPNR